MTPCYLVLQVTINVSDPSFKLDDLLALQLHKYEEEVRRGWLEQHQEWRRLPIQPTLLRRLACLYCLHRPACLLPCASLHTSGQQAAVATPSSHALHILPHPSQACLYMCTGG